MNLEPNEKKIVKHEIFDRRTPVIWNRTGKSIRVHYTVKGIEIHG